LTQLQEWGLNIIKLTNNTLLISCKGNTFFKVKEREKREKRKNYRSSTVYGQLHAPYYYEEDNETHRTPPWNMVFGYREALHAPLKRCRRLPNASACDTRINNFYLFFNLIYANSKVPLTPHKKTKKPFNLSYRLFDSKGTLVTILC